MFFNKLAAICLLAAAYTKASNYSITYYSDGACQTELGTAGNEFDVSGCNSIQGTNSIMVTSLDGAQIKVWVSRTSGSEHTDK
jgi:hypothetical protein